MRSLIESISSFEINESKTALESPAKTTFKRNRNSRIIVIIIITNMNIMTIIIIIIIIAKKYCNCVSRIYREIYIEIKMQ